MGTDQDDRIPVVIGRDDHLSLNWNMFLTGRTNHYDHGDSVESERYQETAAAERAQTEANPAAPRGPVSRKDSRMPSPSASAGIATSQQ